MGLLQVAMKAQRINDVRGCLYPALSERRRLPDQSSTMRLSAPMSRFKLPMTFESPVKSLMLPAIFCVTEVLLRAQMGVANNKGR